MGKAQKSPDNIRESPVRRAVLINGQDRQYVIATGVNQEAIVLVDQARLTIAAGYPAGELLQSLEQ
ncbi:MAG: hypothetical protein R3E95_17190 [Thiolinea sp.]